jgi:hypothetical protein
MGTFFRDRFGTALCYILIARNQSEPHRTLSWLPRTLQLLDWMPLRSETNQKWARILDPSCATSKSKQPPRRGQACTRKTMEGPNVPRNVQILNTEHRSLHRSMQTAPGTAWSHLQRRQSKETTSQSCDGGHQNVGVTHFERLCLQCAGQEVQALRRDALGGDVHPLSYPLQARWRRFNCDYCQPWWLRGLRILAIIVKHRG